MCGRFTLRTSPAEMAEIFRLLREPELFPRYNIAPTQPVAVIRNSGGARDLSMMNWGLIPSWAKDPAIGSKMINARSETAAIKPAFRSAYRRRRCLIPADGFYEWKKTGGRTKQPYYILMKDEQPFAFAGLWEHWESDDGTAIDSCTILTTDANKLLGDLHERMPVILPEESYDRWLDEKLIQADDLQPLLAPYSSDEMKFYAISTTVNSPRNESPECIEPVPEQDTLF